MAGALGVVITTDVPVEGRAAVPVYVDDSLPIVGPARACVVVPADGSMRLAGGPPLAVRLAPAGSPAVGPALPVYVVSGSLSSAPAIFDPLTLSPRLWYKPAGLSSLSNNDPIGTWTDASGNGSDATQATGTAKPTYKSSGGPGGSAYADFDGGDFLASPSIAWALPITVGIVCKLPTPANKVAFSRGTNLLLYSFNGSSGKINDGTDLTFSVTISNWNYIIAVFNGASSVINCLGTETSGNAGSNNPATGSFQMGRYSTGGFEWVGQIAEMIVIPSALSAGQRANLASYFAATYGL